MNIKCPYCTGKDTHSLYIADINDNGLDRYECWNHNRVWVVKTGSNPLQIN